MNVADEDAGNAASCQALATIGPREAAFSALTAQVAAARAE
jgi:hypothetical protein